MRYESKHSYFKQLSNSLGNYINICHTLAVRHEQLRCCKQMEDLCSQEIETGLGTISSNGGGSDGGVVVVVSDGGGGSDGGGSEGGGSDGGSSSSSSSSSTVGAIKKLPYCSNTHIVVKVIQM